MQHKLIKIPANTNDIGDLREFSDAIKEVNAFHKNLSKFAEKIFYDKYCKDLTEWDKILSDADKKKINFQELLENDHGQFVFDSINKHFFDLYFMQPRGWIMGAVSIGDIQFSFSDCANYLIITQHWETQSSRMSHIPWIPHSHTWKINIITNEIIDARQY